jgi:hypothetical protein
VVSPDRRAPTLFAAAFFLVTTVLIAACGGSSRPTVAPSTASATVAAVFGLDGAEQSCLTKAFAADKAATRPLATNSPAHDDDLAALGRVAHSCIPADTLAAAVVAGAADGSKALSATKQQCVHGQVAALSAGDQATVLAGLTVPNVLDDIQTALVGKIADGVLRHCQIGVPTSEVPDITATTSTTIQEQVP